MTNDYKVRVGVQVDTSDIQKQLSRKNDATLKTAIKIKADEASINDILSKLNKTFSNKIGFEIDTKSAHKALNEISKTYSEIRKEVYQSLGKKSPVFEKTKKYYQVQDKSSKTSQNRYYEKIIEDNKQIYALKNKLLNADVKQTAEINKQIKALSQRNKYNSEQLSKKGLSDTSWDRVINDSQVALDNQYKINAAKKEDLTYSQAISKAADITSNLNTKSYEAQISSITAKSQKWTGVNDEVKISTEGINQAYKALQVVSTIENAEERTKALIDAEQLLKTEISRTNNELSIQNLKFANDNEVDSLKLKVQDFYEKDTATQGNWENSILGFIDELNSGAPVAKSQSQEIKAELVRNALEMRKANKSEKSFPDKVIEQAKKFSQWINESSVIMSFWHELRNGAQFVSELNSSLTNINYTMDISSKKLTDIGKASLATAKELKTSAFNVLSVVTTYANANETAQSIIEKARPTIMLSTHTGMDTATTTDILQGTISQFNLNDTEESLLHISDVFEKVSQNMKVDFAKGIKEIAEGVQVSGNVAKDAGFNLENYSALLGKIIEKSRSSGSEIGRANRTIFTRITKASSAALAGGEVTEDDISNAEKALRRIGVETRKDTDTFRDVNDIMTDLYGKLDTLSQVDLSNLAYELAGTKQTTVFKMLVQSWGEYLDLAKEAQNADGTTLANQEIYADSLAGKYGELTASAQNFYNSLVSSDTLGLLASYGTVALDVLTALNDKIHILNVSIGVGLGRVISKYLSGKGLDYRKYDTAQLLQGSDKSYCYG